MKKDLFYFKWAWEKRNINADLSKTYLPIWLINKQTLSVRFNKLNFTLINIFIFDTLINLDLYMERDDPLEERPNSVIFSSQGFAAVKMSFRVSMGYG